MAAKKSSKAKTSASKVIASKTGKKKAASSVKKTAAANSKSAKTAKKSAVTKKVTTKKAPAKKAPAKKAPAKKSPAKKAVSKKASSSKPAVTKTSPAKTAKSAPSKPKAGSAASKQKSPSSSRKQPKDKAVSVKTNAKPGKPVSAIPASLAKKLPPIKKLSSPFRNDSTPKTVIREDREWTVAELKKIKTGLNKKDLDYFKGLLLDRRAEIIGSVTGMETVRADRSDDSSSMPLHMADIGSENFDEEFNLGLMASERKLLHEINEAIRRLIEGYYGVCLESGEPINRERLEAKPWAKYTIEVARERERRGLSSG